MKLNGIKNIKQIFFFEIYKIYFKKDVKVLKTKKGLSELFHIFILIFYPIKLKPHIPTLGTRTDKLKINKSSYKIHRYLSVYFHKITTKFVN